MSAFILWKFKFGDVIASAVKRICIAHEEEVLLTKGQK